MFQKTPFEDLLLGLGVIGFILYLPYYFFKTMIEFILSFGAEEPVVKETAKKDEEDDIRNNPFYHLDGRGRVS